MKVTKLREQIKKLPARPGVYLFRRGGRVLYVGKATNLRERVRSYLPSTALVARGPWIAAMVEEAARLEFRVTDSVLEALLLEAELIKKYQPPHNSTAKDDKSFWYLIFTKEKFPRVLPVRGRNLGEWEGQVAQLFGPFPSATEFKLALKLLRKIFPWRDNRCAPESGQACWAANLGLCPGVCAGLITAVAYKKRLAHLRLFLAGKKQKLLRELASAMSRAAKEWRFEEAARLKRQINALKSIQDVALMRREVGANAIGTRLEAYDVAHLGGHEAVGVMVVSVGGELAPAEYRKFRLRLPSSRRGDDLAALKEILLRRLAHAEWPLPELVLVDGGSTQLNAARQTIRAAGFNLPVIAVVKDKHHRPERFLGEALFAQRYQNELLALNQEAHRFAIKYHRQLRDRVLQ